MFYNMNNIVMKPDMLTLLITNFYIKIPFVFFYVGRRSS
jgi:hypothetical protein